MTNGERTTHYQKTESNTYNNSSSSSSSSTSTSSTTNGRDPAEISMDLSAIRDEHMECLGRQMPSFIQSMVRRHLEAGIPMEYYIYALHETACAPRPSWKYTEAIVRRLIREGVEMSILDLY